MEAPLRPQQHQQQRLKLATATATEFHSALNAASTQCTVLQMCKQQFYLYDAKDASVERPLYNEGTQSMLATVGTFLL